MKLLVEVPDAFYEYAMTLSSEELRHLSVPYNAIYKGTPLPPNVMVIDKDKLEFDSDWNAYYDSYTAYSQIALEAAELEVK